VSLSGRIARGLVAALSLAAILAAALALSRGSEGLSARHLSLGPTPVTVLAPVDGARGPAVVIAHGFAGSRQLMEPFAITLARNGYTAVSFDFLGHGDNAEPLTGDITTVEGATQRLLDELDRVIGFARGLEGAEGRVALLGHSMATDIVARRAVTGDDIAATVAVSMGPRTVESVVTADAPRNLLVVSGEWEAPLREAALEAVEAAAGAPAEEGVSYGSFADGTARRAVAAPNVEHVGVLYSPTSLREAHAWLDAAFGLGPGPGEPGGGTGYAEVRGPWIALLLAGIVALAWPLAALLPRLEAPEAGAALRGRRFLAVAGGTAVATPLLLWPVPTGFLPVLVADYLAVHFAVYGVLLAAGLGWAGAWPRGPGSRPAAALAAAGAMALYGVFAMGLALDAHVASFMPHWGRAPVILALLAGILPYMLAEEWLARGHGSPWWSYAAAKVLFLLSLALAVALNLEDLFFLIIILPVIVLFFVIYGLFAAWVTRATGQPGVAGIANAAAFAWALGVTFPLVGG
jgi:dienelactone hydrolase